MPAGNTLVGVIDCISVSILQDKWFYDDGSQFQPCITNCKKCSSGNECDFCENQGNSALDHFLQKGPPDQCTETVCEASPHWKFRPWWYNCLQCNPNFHYLEGSVPPRCDSWLPNSGYYKEAGTLICKSCPAHCQTCLSPTRCTTCKNLNHYLAVDEISCGEVCPQRQTKASGTPKRCVNCGSNCKQCTEIACEQCDPGFFEELGSCFSCPIGCEECIKESGTLKCTKCFNPTYFIKSDLSGCSDDCQAGETKDSPNKRCWLCETNCATCGQNGCNLCKDTFYKKTGENTCIACPSGCKKCYSNIDCSECLGPTEYVATDGVSCSPDCQQREYKDDGTMTCKTCPTNCA